MRIFLCQGQSFLFFVLLLDDLLNFDTYSNLKFNLNLPKVDGESKEDERRWKPIYGVEEAGKKWVIALDSVERTKLYYTS